MRACVCLTTRCACASVHLTSRVKNSSSDAASTRMLSSSVPPLPTCPHTPPPSLQCHPTPHEPMLPHAPAPRRPALRPYPKASNQTASPAPCQTPFTPQNLLASTFPCFPSPHLNPRPYMFSPISISFPSSPIKTLSSRPLSTGPLPYLSYYPTRPCPYPISPLQHLFPPTPHHERRAGTS